jgi:hypothetical protein
MYQDKRDAEAVEAGDGLQAGIGRGGVFHRATAKLHHDRAAAMRAHPFHGRGKIFSGNTRFGHPGRPTKSGYRLRENEKSIVFRDQNSVNALVNFHNFAGSEMNLIGSCSV